MANPGQLNAKLGGLDLKSGAHGEMVVLAACLLMSIVRFNALNSFVREIISV